MCPIFLRNCIIDYNFILVLFAVSLCSILFSFHLFFLILVKVDVHISTSEESSMSLSELSEPSGDHEYDYIYNVNKQQSNNNHTKNNNNDVYIVSPQNDNDIYQSPELTTNGHTENEQKPYTNGFYLDETRHNIMNSKTERDKRLIESGIENVTTEPMYNGHTDTLTNGFFLNEQKRSGSVSSDEVSSSPPQNVSVVADVQTQEDGNRHEKESIPPPPRKST